MRVTWRDKAECVDVWHFEENHGDLYMRVTNDDGEIFVIEAYIAPNGTVLFRTPFDNGKEIRIYHPKHFYDDFRYVGKV